MKVNEYREEAQAAEAVIKGAEARVAAAREELRAAEAKLDELRMDNFRTLSDYHFARDGFIPVRPNSWIAAEYLREHPDVFEEFKAQGRFGDGWEDLWSA